MQHRARNIVTGAVLALTLTGGLTACSSDSTPESGDESSPGRSPSSAPEASPGTYRTLPEPCGAVSRATLKSLLPGVEAPDGEKSGDAYEGSPALTYDTDRRVGCSWKSSTPDGSRHLTVDLERVVSYDPSVSDDEQAEKLFDERAEKAGIAPDGEPSQEATPGGSASPSSGSGKDGEEDDKGTSPEGARSGSEKERDKDGGGEDSSSPGTASPGESDEDLSPRMLGGIGRSAWIDDELATEDSGVHRDITLVFRSANVLATVVYEEWPATKEDTPDSRELQEKTQRVAMDLSRRFDED